MFKKKVTVEEFEEYKHQTDKKIEELQWALAILNDSLEMNPNPENIKNSPMKKSRKSPTSFFNKLLDFLFNDESVKHFDGWFYNENLSPIAQKYGDKELKIKISFVNKFWEEIYHPSNGMERGFYKRAINNGVIKETGYKESPHRTTAILPNGKTGNFVIITNDFLEKFKEEEMNKIIGG